VKSHITAIAIVSTTLLAGCYSRIGEGVGRNLAQAFAKVDFPDFFPTGRYLSSHSMRVVRTTEEKSFLRPALGRYSSETGNEAYIFCFKELNSEHSRDAVEFVRLAQQYPQLRFICEENGFNSRYPAFVEIISAPKLFYPAGQLSLDEERPFTSTRVSISELEKRLGAAR